MVRRGFLNASSAAVAGTAIAGCSVAPSRSAYATAVARTWRPFAGTSGEGTLTELVRFATLAPSSHNTQCWSFQLRSSGLTIRPDFSRRCPIVDPDDHHLFVSLGCACENLIQAAGAMGLRGTARFEPADGGAIQIELEPTAHSESGLARAIPMRGSTRGPFDGSSVAPATLMRLERAAQGKRVHAELITDRRQIERILASVVEANSAEMAEPGYMDELRHWIRFNERTAVATGDGLFTGATGNPSIPTWFGNAAFDLIVRPAGENDRYAKLVRSSAGIAIFSSGVNGPEQWIEAGRSFQRFALTAAALGIRTSMLNQPIEVARLRGPFASAFDITGRPDLVVRFGYGPEMPRSLRRAVGSVIA